MVELSQAAGHLTEAVMQVNPAARILYLLDEENPHKHRELLPPDSMTLVKPFTAATLLRTMREMLDRVPAEES
jgi:hypothetical protein